MTEIVPSRQHRLLASERGISGSPLISFVAASVLMFCIGVRTFAASAEPEGYRTEDYRAPTPLTLRGARVVNTAEAEALWKSQAAVFVDVLPQPPRPHNLPKSAIWHERLRLDIPGSTWLPDTGYGALAPAMLSYFADGLHRATGGDRDKTVVMYCMRDCWMSWNAAKRALTMGYSNVVWYPDGTDGWAEAGLPLSQAQHKARPGE